MPRNVVRLKDLNLFALPTIALNSSAGWGAVHGLPESPGCYVVSCMVARRKVSRLSEAERKNYSRGIVYALGRENALNVNKALMRGNQAVVTLYIGSSGNLRKRWAGSTQHHKQDDLRATSFLLGSIFDLVSLEMRYLLSQDNDSARIIEASLIKLWNPALNGRAPIALKAA